MLPLRPDVPGPARDDNGAVGSHHPFALAAGLLAIASSALADPGHDLPGSSASGDLPSGPERAAGAGPGDEPGTLAVVDGVVQSVDLAGHRITLDVKGTPVLLEVDRNTLVYLPTGLSTVFELRPGELVRAGRNDRSVAFWLQVRPPAPAGGEAKTRSSNPPVNEPEPALEPGK